MARYTCKTKCYFQDQLFEVGKEFSTDDPEVMKSPSLADHFDCLDAPAPAAKAKSKDKDAAPAPPATDGDGK